MKNYHKAGMISPARIYACLDYLVKNHPAYKNIQIEKEEKWRQKCCSFFDNAESDDDAICDANDDFDFLGSLSPFEVHDLFDNKGQQNT